MKSGIPPSPACNEQLAGEHKANWQEGAQEAQANSRAKLSLVYGQEKCRLAERWCPRYSLGLQLSSKTLLTLKINKVVFSLLKDFQQSVTVVLLQDEHTLISAGAVDG